MDLFQGSDDPSPEDQNAESAEEASAVTAEKANNQRMSTSTPINDTLEPGFATERTTNDAVRPRSAILIDETPNFYHQAFRRPHLTAHPSTYIPGYPTDALPLNLSLDAASLDVAIEADQALFSNLEQGRLYFLPGTNILGFMAVGTSFDLNKMSEHGTAVAASAVGYPFGGNPEAGLIVIQETLGNVANFLAANPWIDIYSSSIAFFAAAVGGPTANGEHHLKEFVDRGGIALHSVSNNDGVVGPDMVSADAGPPWVVAVGQIGDSSRGDGHGAGPVDISAVAPPCALADAMDGYDDDCGGTSYATPWIAGYLSRLLEDVRALGIDGECPATEMACGVHGFTNGPLADGILSRDDLLDAAYRTAKTAQAPATFYVGKANFTDRGWGYVDSETFAFARDVLYGLRERSERPNEEFWWNQFQLMRRMYWTPWGEAYDQIPDGPL